MSPLKTYQRTGELISRCSPGFRVFFKLLWPGFQDKFSIILANIENHKLVIDREMNLTHIKDTYEARNKTVTYIKDAYDARNKALAEYEEILAIREQQQLESLERYLNAPLYDEELEKINEERGQDTGQWLFQDLSYERWVDPNHIDVANCTLWISGIPGAGKRIKHELEDVDSDFRCSRKNVSMCSSHRSYQK